MVHGSGFMVQGSGCGVWDVECRQDLELCLRTALARALQKPDSVLGV